MLIQTRDTHIPICMSCEEALIPRDGELCRKCSVALVSEETYCGRCRERENNFNSNYSLFCYEGQVREIIRLYKTKGIKSLARLFASKLTPILTEKYASYVVVPVPFRKAGKRNRGWDQVEAICRILKRRYGFDVRRLLKRKGSKSQKSLDYAQRMTNLRGKIYMRRGVRKVPVQIVLLDDIFTTGATGDACAEVLYREGAIDVQLLTIAID